VHKFSVDPESQHFEQASRVISWIEDGIFDALVNGYLEKCMLVVAHDEQCENPIEVWDLTLTWDGDMPTPSVGCASARSDQGRHEASLAAPASGAASAITKDDVRRAAQMMMRRLSCLLQGLDEIPNDHWIGMRLLYRDGVTPKEYEPSGFYQAPSTDAGCFVFQAPPTFVSAGRLATGLNSLSVGVAMAEVPGFDPTLRDKACTAATDDGGYLFDLVRATTSEPNQNVPLAVSSSASAGDRLPQLIERAKALLSERLGSQITAHALARELRTSPPIAEEVLQHLQAAESPVVSTVRPSTRSREVLDPEAQYAASQWDASSCNDGEMSEASCVRHAPAGHPHPRFAADGKSFTAASPGSKSARPSCRQEGNPSRGLEAAASLPASVRDEGKRGSQQAATPAALPAREPKKFASKRKASQVLEPIGRASLRHASSQRS
jgi:hypothetical protein